MLPAEPARIHLLPAKQAHYVVLVRRKPSKCFHIIRWNTKTDELEHGSWFRGKLYPMRCDVSFDGKWMVYLAMGTTGNSWNGICKLPFLKTEMEGPSKPAGSTWFGGGFWKNQQTLLLNNWEPQTGHTPFDIEQHASQFGGEDLGVFFPRLERDGWRRAGDHFGMERKVKDVKNYTIECVGDDGWEVQPSPDHPVLRAKYIGYLRHGYTFRYSLDGYDDVLDDRVDSACWDRLGNLVFSRDGVVYRYSLRGIRKGEPDHVIDLEPLEAPSKEQRKSS